MRVAAIVAGALVAVAGSANAAAPAFRVSAAVAQQHGQQHAIAVFGQSGRQHDKALTSEQDKGDSARPNPDVPCCSATGKNGKGKAHQTGGGKGDRGTGRDAHNNQDCAGCN